MFLEKLQNSLNFREADSRKFFWWSFIFLLLTVFIFHGKTVPYSNEYVYLLRLVPNFLPNDWTFGEAANEHWLFNSIFSLPAYIFSIEIVGWLGRIAVWTLCLIILLKIGKHWKIPPWATAVSIFLWLAFGQSVVGGEWIFGGFEAKTAAYVCLLLALEAFAREKIILPACLLGLSFSFHPAVGFWAIPAVGLALLVERIPTVAFLRLVGLTFIFALPGIIPIFVEQNDPSAYSFDNWKFIVMIRAPENLDPFQFSRSGIFLLYAMLVFNFFALEKCKSFALGFLLKFQIVLGLFFMLGVILRWLEIYPLLRLMPMRLFPIVTPLFFLWTAFYVFPRYKSKRQQLIIAFFVVSVVALLNPFGKGYGQMRETIETWTAPRDDFQKTALWIAANTPKDALIIQPPSRRDVWYFSKRGSIVSFFYPTYDRLSQWRERVAELTGNRHISRGETAGEEIEAAYNQLPQAQIDQIKQKYGAGFLVSRAVYSYPIVFETESYKVYQLP